MTDKEHTLEELPSVIPVFPLSGVILLPGASLPLNIFEPRYLKMVRDAEASHKLIGMVQPKDKDEGGKKPALYGVGGMGMISELKETGDGRFLIRLKGISRFRIEEELSTATPYRQVRANWAPFAADPWGGETTTAVERDDLFTSLKAYLDIKGLEADFSAIAEAPDDVLVNTLSMIVPFAHAEKQALLEAETVYMRSALLRNLLTMAATSTMKSEGPAKAH
ncbi:LON peptidase substrate-binding domain-containing protein [Kordiimonas aestuarii]|uniref:LON peptidase substrate-binding domain-containing protein n=1 Tax=Kordiimonas aestuarii TaxID=1005925 RepID=UPI0021D3AEEC|nr:LON peptidase substrate-binding domain-containing protein [Kordiimonas aestuarii]